MPLMLDHAIEIAKQAHDGQVDKAGQPYINHPMRVMAACAQDEMAAMAAILHDVAEDCPEWPIERLRAEGFPAPVIEALALLCHDKDVPYLDYIMAIKGNPIAKRVKLADLADNMNLDRLPDPGPADHQRIAKYQAAKQLLIG
jgi:guanosine-3',5'-bis(diphosphate) 3'-pyrophosphohydrolase